LRQYCRQPKVIFENNVNLMKNIPKIITNLTNEQE
jgi:hypothetical protein